jgi:hypothetical protein
MTAGFSEDLNQKVRSPIENLGLEQKPFRRCHMTDDLHDTRNSIQCSERLFGNCQGIQESQPGCLYPLLDRQVTSKFPGENQLAVSHGKDAGQKQEVPSLDRRNIGRQWLRRRRQREI